MMLFGFLMQLIDYVIAQIPPLIHVIVVRMTYIGNASKLNFPMALYQKVFLNYTFQFIDNEYGLIEDKDTLIQLTELTNKEIRFRSSSPFLIEPDNFLKEYGAITDEAIDSITIIFQKADNYRKNQQQKAYANLCKKIDSLYNPGKIKNSRIRL